MTFNNQGQYTADTDAYGNANTLTYSSGVPTSETDSGWPRPDPGLQRRPASDLVAHSG